jgi:homoserine O-succinyltransferase
LHIGLVNNMPDAALRATELQFARLLKEAAGNFDVRLHLFSIPEIPRGAAAISRMDGFYADVATLPDAGMDALIITGAEPYTDGLNDEPYWRALTRLMDWAESGTVSILFSCLAAHAAVLHFDGILRRPLPKKISGVFTSLRAVDDPLLAGIPSRAATPHSRKNGLLESDLTAHNYRVLTRLTDGSVDLFVRDGRSRFVFLQGHPEYSADTLGREYLRDMARFLKGEGARPIIPENYFDRVTENALQALSGREAQISDYNEVVMGAVPLQSWRSYSLRLFANWIASIASEKPRRRAARAAPVHRSA